jgi:hypothetical protein
MGMFNQPRTSPALPVERPDWRWRYEESVPAEPALSRENETRERLVDRCWFRLQVLHTPFRATDRREYQQLVDWLKKLEGLFLEHPAFEQYYLECFAEELAQDPPHSSTPPSAEINHLAGSQARFMEEVFFSLQLDRYANAPDNRGWMNLFRRWGRSRTFNDRLDQLRATFTMGFLEFYDYYLRYYPFRIDEDPIPHCWDPEARRTDPRDFSERPPLKAGGETGRLPPDLAEPRPGHPRGAILPGIFLDSGLRETRRTPPRQGERPVPRPGEGEHGHEDAKGGRQGYEASPESGTETSGGSAPTTPNE